MTAFTGPYLSADQHEDRFRTARDDAAMAPASLAEALYDTVQCYIGMTDQDRAVYRNAIQLAARIVDGRRASELQEYLDGKMAALKAKETA
jgi:hypothetical protein